MSSYLYSERCHHCHHHHYHNNCRCKHVVVLLCAFYQSAVIRYSQVNHLFRLFNVHRYCVVSIVDCVGYFHNTTILTLIELTFFVAAVIINDPEWTVEVTGNSELLTFLIWIYNSHTVHWLRNFPLTYYALCSYTLYRVLSHRLLKPATLEYKKPNY